MSHKLPKTPNSSKNTLFNYFSRSPSTTNNENSPNLQNVTKRTRIEEDHEKNVSGKSHQYFTFFKCLL